MRQLALLVCFSALLTSQQPPTIVSLEPAQGAEIDAAKVKELVIVFDRPMSQTGHSLCGGGPSFPNVKGNPGWRNNKTFVVPVELVPDHLYSLGVNCPSFQNFRGADGTPLVPVPWSFSTVPTELRKPGEQKQRNQKALATLTEVLEKHYSYRDLRIKDWSKLEKQYSPAMLAAKTDRGFATAAAEMLRGTQDIHLCLRLGDQTFPTGMMLQRAVDCTVVGQPTFGSSGNPKPFELGNDVTIVVPTWQDLRLDGTPIEGEGLAPDVLVPCTDKELQSHDPILGKALEILREKVAKPR